MGFWEMLDIHTRAGTLGFGPRTSQSSLRPGNSLEAASLSSQVIEDLQRVTLSPCLPSCPFLQTRQPVFVQLLQGVFRVYHCNWLMPSQKASVESCIRVLSDVGEMSGLTGSRCSGYM